MKRILAAALLGLLSLSALAEESDPQPSDINYQQVKYGGRVGQHAAVEFDALYGTFVGARLKGKVHSGGSYNIAVEGLYGRLIQWDFYSTTYGAGLRGEFYLSSSGKHAWMILPGLDAYYSKAHPCPPQDTQGTVGGMISADIELGFCSVSSTPTSVITIAPNVDFSWIYQFGPHFGITAGLRAGAGIAVSGKQYGDVILTSQSTEDYLGDKSVAGKVFPDVGFYVGTRF